jgi:hypothetical protein
VQACAEIRGTTTTSIITPLKPVGSANKIPRSCASLRMTTRSCDANLRDGTLGRWGNVFLLAGFARRAGEGTCPYVSAATP